MAGEMSWDCSRLVLWGICRSEIQPAALRVVDIIIEHQALTWHMLLASDLVQLALFTSLF